MIYLSEKTEQYTQNELAIMLLKYGLFHEYGITGDLLLEREEKGKPYLREYPSIYFNYSHSKHEVLCGIDTAPVGVDIEGVITYKERLARRICHPNELQILEEAADKNIALTRIWTTKESYLKYTGEGIRSDLRLLDFSMCTNRQFKTMGCEFTVISSDKFSFAVCSRNTYINIVQVDLEKK